jgi:hypothetical protein
MAGFILNFLVVLSVIQAKNAINLREYGKLFHPQRKESIESDYHLSIRQFGVGGRVMSHV